MSLWGDKELIAGANSGTIQVFANGLVTGTSSDFANDMEVGNFIRADNQLLVITSITDATTAQVSPGYLGGTVSAVSSGTSYAVLQAPKSLAYTDGTLDGESDAVLALTGGDDDVVFVDTTEAASANNGARGLGTGGWTRYQTYQDADGNTRYKTEVLVAMRRTAAQAGDAEDIITADS